MAIANGSTAVIALSAAAIAVAGCQAEVPPPALDETAPVSRMDVYGVPGEGQAVDVSGTCCAVSRRVARNSIIDALGSGEDPESGITDVEILYTWNGLCTDQFGTISSSQGSPVMVPRLAKNHATQDPATTPAFPVRLLVSGQLKIGDYVIGRRCAASLRIVLLGVIVAKRA